ncbi:MAG TPA: cytochrome c-type biogenesis protein CcmH [Actinomycetota bacterium]|nr:cytochrome c-type biogenesis protein CcmH [Actinomycetota bacterium]
MRRLLPLVAVAALVLVAVATGLSAARGPNPDAVPTAQEVDERTMSPFCVGLTLAACPSSEALQLRATIAGMVADGKTNRQIDSFLLANYPKTVIGAPRSPVAWLVPAAAVMAGLALVVVVAFRRRGGSGAGEPAEPLPPIPPGDGARLAADLRRFAQGTSE